MPAKMTIELIYPNWPHIEGICAVSTTRKGGVSQIPFEGLNVGAHVGDATDCVSANRDRLLGKLSLSEHYVCWLNQVHGSVVCEAGTNLGKIPDADGAFTRRKNTACVVMTADCLPVLLASIDGSAVAAVHAGWRGLSCGVLEAAIDEFDSPAQLQAWLGPAIGPAAFEVGSDVKLAFTNKYSGCERYFEQGRPHKWYADLFGLARQILNSRGVERIFGGNYCTYSDPALFYSFRRDGLTGRMATLIWKR